MKNPDEDIAYETWRQAKIDRDWDNLPSRLTSIPIHQKVGTVIPFSRTTDKDPNPRIPLSIPQEVPNPSLVFILSALAMLLILLLVAS
jgi:hypothetical protein